MCPISSSGQDSWFSPSRPGFDSPYGNPWKGNIFAENSFWLQLLMLLGMSVMHLFNEINVWNVATPWLGTDLRLPTWQGRFRDLKVYSDGPLHCHDVRQGKHASMYCLEKWWCESRWSGCRRAAAPGAAQRARGIAQLKPLRIIRARVETLW